MQELLVEGRALTKLDTIHKLAILGGLGAVLSPFISLFVSGGNIRNYWIFQILNFYSVGVVVFILLLIASILASIMAVRAANFVSKMPQRAASDLKASGILILIVGIISLTNVLAVISGILILAVGVECDAIWKKIQHARTQTGWPYVTVATAAGSTWARRTSCEFCGAPLVIKKATAREHLILIETQCPLDNTFDTVQLPLSRLDSWTAVAADRLHRCEKCGNRTAALIMIGQSGVTTSLQAYCPRGHSNRTYRKVWTPLYPHIAQTPSVNLGFQGRPKRYQFQSIFQDHYRSTFTQPIPISSRKSGLTYSESIGFCTQCGVKIELSDTYCFRCGHQIN